MQKRDLVNVGILIVTIAVYFGYYQPMVTMYQRQLQISEQQLRLLQSQLVKKPLLILTIYPSFDINMTNYMNGTYVIENTTLPFRPGSNVTFHIFLSNIGTSPSVAQYLTVAYSIESGPGGSSLKRLEPVILRAEDSREWTYDLHLPWIHVRTNGVISFAIMTTDGTVAKTVRFLIIPFSF